MSRGVVRLERTPPGAGDGVPPPAGGAGIAVDVLRATSTLARARAHGAGRIVPFARTDEAAAFRDATTGALACGEREGRRLPGFDLGNSPFEYTRERVEGRTLAFASTNGSRALLALAGTDPVWLGAFVCASAVARACAGAAHVRIVCAGERGQPSPEDDACGGWIVARLLDAGFEAGDGLTRDLAAAAPADAAAVRERVERSPHGRVLTAMGAAYARDVEWCATLDAMAEAWRA